MADKHLFYYLGEDEAYYKALKTEFESHSKLSLEFRSKFATTEEEIQTFFVMIYKEKPSVVFLDFSKHGQDYLHLARLLHRTPMDHKVILVGIQDYLSPVEILTESNVTGVHFSYIKSAETFDVVFDVCKLLKPEGISHGFATSSLKESLEVGVLCKIGYVHEGGLHIETDFPLSKGERIVFNHHWHKKNIVPSREMFVKDVSTKNMFYQFKYNADLDFLFADEIVSTDGLDMMQILLKQKERAESILSSKKELKSWIEANAKVSVEKKTMVLAVDNTFKFYQNQQRTDKHGYTLRCIPKFTDMGEEIGRLRPNVIAFEVDKTDQAVNTMDVLTRMVQMLKVKYPDLNPFIIVFNTDLPSDHLKAQLEYPQIMAHEGEMAVEVMVRMCNLVEKKMASRFIMDSVLSQRVYLKKTDYASIGEIVKQVTVVKLSETDMIIESDIPFPAGTNLHFTHPVEMFVNITPIKSSGKLPQYFGLIHSLGEMEKQELRRFVNTVFFRDHDAQVHAESEEFRKLNETKLQQRQELEKKKAQESEKSDKTPEAEPSKP